MINPDIDKIEAVLPQTQCGLCSYGGCRPYAEAMVKQGEAINRCTPGGIETLKTLATLLQHNPEPFLDEMRQKQKPFAVAKIREAECNGCTKCIQACPVDAIIGSGKMMHTILRSKCTGCELCIAPCPVDCIELELLPKRGYDPAKAKARYYHRQQRLNNNVKQKVLINKPQTEQQNNKKAEILAAVARAKAKRIT